MNIVLFGFMGTGKSAVAPVLARRLGLRWADMDALIEEREGSRIEEIFEKKGEPYFRERERELVKELISQEGWVVSTGGGAILDPKNIEDFEKWGLAICLNASIQTIFERTRHRQDRPLLRGSEPLKKIEDLWASRQPFYRRISNQIDTTHKSIHDIVETILEWAKEYNYKNPNIKNQKSK
ncbi:MAG: shikimate kinase [Chlamydiae bacterium]|nr:shikimate kinase [Chlamydiota bacterium]MBI3277278.1 shikimate kinase [Chlamydiota bacterium]